MKEWEPGEDSVNVRGTIRRIEFNAEVDQTFERLGFEEIPVRVYEMSDETSKLCIIISEKCDGTVNLWTLGAGPCSSIADETVEAIELLTVKPSSNPQN
jgi:hypothetical protein